MDRDLQAKINAAYEDVITARKCLLDAKEVAIRAKEALKDQEAELILGGKITGKNETERAAAMRDQTIAWRHSVSEAEKSDRASTLALEYALDARRNLESMLRIEELEAV